MVAVVQELAELFVLINNELNSEAGYYEYDMTVAGSKEIRDEIVKSGSSAVPYDIFISANYDPNSLYYKYQFSHPKVNHFNSPVIKSSFILAG